LSEEEEEEGLNASALAAPAPALAAAALAAPALAAPALKTVPTTKGFIDAAARKYAPNEIFLFYADSGLDDKLKIGYKDAARWLSPLAPFDIRDPEDGTRYPTVEHYMAAMKIKKASPSPELAERIFSAPGFIHVKYISKRLAETGAGAGAKKLTEKRDWELLKEEWTEVKRESAPAVLKKTYKIDFNEAAWIAIKDEVLLEALRQRFEEDVKFRKIVEAVKEQGKILLYYQTAVASELGGVLKDGKIQGDNKLGRLIMQLASFPE
jgi:predicted NAD-dependent protein-ADP-ribosyltransferase YbiA (DUF1768 family)